MPEREFSRRRFLRGAAVLGAASLLPGDTPRVEPQVLLRQMRELPPLPEFEPPEPVGKDSEGNVIIGRTLWRQKLREGGLVSDPRHDEMSKLTNKLELVSEIGRVVTQVAGVVLNGRRQTS